jgi:hypothetical protein
MIFTGPAIPNMARILAYLDEATTVDGETKASRESIANAFGKKRSSRGEGRICELQLTTLRDAGLLTARRGFGGGTFISEKGKRASMRDLFEIEGAESDLWFDPVLVLLESVNAIEFAREYLK